MLRISLDIKPDISTGTSGSAGAGFDPMSGEIKSAKKSADCSSSSTLTFAAFEVGRTSDEVKILFRRALLNVRGPKFLQLPQRYRS